MTEGKKAGPFIKWVGGKRNLLPDLLARLPGAFKTYHEPFIGGGALFFEIADRVESALLADTNSALVTTYYVIKREPKALMALVDKHARQHSDEYYYRIRSQHDLQDPLKIAARFLYLNKTCYNGLYRVNKQGQFNVPVGRYVNPTIYREDNLLACSEVLRKVKIELRDFETVEAESGDFIYCDPPYHPLDSASFTKYAKLDFTEEDQTRLRDYVLRMHKKGAQVMVSNSDTTFIRELYSSPIFTAAVVQAPRFVNCKPGKRNAINELLITTYGIEKAREGARDAQGRFLPAPVPARIIPLGKAPQASALPPSVRPRGPGAAQARHGNAGKATRAHDLSLPGG